MDIGIEEAQEARPGLQEIIADSFNLNEENITEAVANEALAPEHQEVEAVTFGISKGPVHSVDVTPITETWEELTARLSAPAIGDKGGSYITCSPFNDNYRDGDHQDGQHGGFFVIDADSRIDLDTGEVFGSDKGAPAPELAHEALKDLDIPHIIFSTHSNVLKGHRYRILIPVSWPVSKANLAALYHWTMVQLHAAGVGIAITPESLKPAQLWFLPRVPDQQSMDRFYFAEFDGGCPFPSDTAATWWEANGKDYAVKSETKQKFSDDKALDLDTPIGQFNAENSVEWMSRALIAAGYQFKANSTSNGCASYRYLHPDSGSGSPGTVLFKTTQGVWRVYSHSGNDVLLGDGYAHDAFDLHTIFNHGADQRAALESIGLLQEYTCEELKTMVEEADANDTNAKKRIVDRLAGSKLEELDSEDVMKLVSAKFKTSITPIRAQVKSTRKRAAKKAKKEEGKPGMVIAQECLSNYGADNVLFSEGAIWLWEARGVWAQYPPEYVDQVLIHNYLRGRYPDWSFTTAIVNDTRGLIRGSQAIVGGMQPEVSEHYINTKNCELHWSDEEAAWQAFEHDKKNRSTNQCNFTANNDAKCERWDRFMLEVFANTGTPEEIREQIELLQAMIAYAMTTSTKLERFLYLWSPLGGTGKSKIAAVITHLLGLSNVVGVQPGMMSNNFHLAHMDKKLANIVTEVKEGTLMDASSVKATATGELVTVAHKGRDPFDARLFATQIYLANFRAAVNDYTDAFFERAVIMKLPNKFRGTETQDVNLEQKLLAELDGIAMRCLGSYGDVLKGIHINGGGWGRPAVVLRQVDEWQGETDNVRQFAEECMREEPGAFVTHADAFRRYEEWCGVNGVATSIKSRTLTNRLNVIFGLEPRGRGTDNVAILKGVNVRSIAGDWVQGAVSKRPYKDSDIGKELFDQYENYYSGMREPRLFEHGDEPEAYKARLARSKKPVGR